MFVFTVIFTFKKSDEVLFQHHRTQVYDWSPFWDDKYLCERMMTAADFRLCSTLKLCTFLSTYCEWKIETFLYLPHSTWSTPRKVDVYSERNRWYFVVILRAGLSGRLGLRIPPQLILNITSFRYWYHEPRFVPWYMRQAVHVTNEL